MSMYHEAEFRAMFRRALDRGLTPSQARDAAMLWINQPPAPF